MCAKKNESAFKKELKSWLWAILAFMFMLLVMYLEGVVGVWLHG